MKLIIRRKTFDYFIINKFKFSIVITRRKTNQQTKHINLLNEHCLIENNFSIVQRERK